jgi:hypothetical protein
VWGEWAFHADSLWASSDAPQTKVSWGSHGDTADSIEPTGIAESNVTNSGMVAVNAWLACSTAVTPSERFLLREGVVGATTTATAPGSRSTLTL